MTDLKSLILHYSYYKFLPRNLIELIDIYRKQKLYDEKKIIFIHVPKAAGTSIAYSIYGKPLGHFKASMFKKHFPEKFEKYFTFAIVRNPLDRLYSAYNFVKQGGTSKVKVQQKKIYTSEYFKTFDSFVYNWLPNADLKKEDYVFQPQYYFTHDENSSLLVDKIWKLEDMDAFVRDMKKIIGDDFFLPHLNKSNKAESPKMVYTDNMKKVVREIYKKDFELFNYE